MAGVKVTPDLERNLNEHVEEENGVVISGLRKHWHIVLKVVQLIFCGFCIGFLMEPAKELNLGVFHLVHLALVFPTFIGYILISIIFVIAKVIGDNIPFKTCSIFAVIAACLYFVSTILLAVHNKREPFTSGRFFIVSNKTLGLLAGSTTFAFFTAGLFAFEAVLSWRFQEDF